MALHCNKQQLKWRFFGQYVQVNQPQTKWENIAKSLCQTAYNGFVVHLLTPFGNINFFPWQFISGRFDLNTKNLKWREKFKEMLIEVGGRGNNVISLCFFDSYITRFNSRPHPFKHNNKGINWGNGNERALYNPYKGGNPNDKKNFTWLFYKTDEDDNVLHYEFLEKFMEDYITDVMIICEEVKKMFPQRFRILFRVHNENGDHFGGDTRVHEVFDMLWKKHAPSFTKGKDLWQADDYTDHITTPEGRQVDLKSLMEGHRYLLTKGRFQEVHNCDANFIDKLRNYVHPRGWKFNLNRMIISTDGLKPENQSFVPRCKQLLSKNLLRIDFKVPSDLTPYYDLDFEKTFNEVLPVMKDINQ